MYQTLNLGFFVFHTLWIVFNCIGWAWRRTRRWQLATAFLTGVSWFGLGISYGWGYCPSTDWHWRVRTHLGYHDPPSYIQLLIRELTSLEVSTTWANTLTAAIFVIVLALSVVTNVRDFRRERSRTMAP